MGARRDHLRNLNGDIGCVHRSHNREHKQRGGAVRSLESSATPAGPKSAAIVPSDRERATPVEKCFVRYEGNFQDMSIVERCLIIFSTYPNSEVIKAPPNQS